MASTPGVTCQKCFNAVMSIYGSRHWPCRTGELRYTHYGHGVIGMTCMLTLLSSLSQLKAGCHITVAPAGCSVVYNETKLGGAATTLLNGITIADKSDHASAHSVDSIIGEVFCFIFHVHDVFRMGL